MGRARYDCASAASECLKPVRCDSNELLCDQLLDADLYLLRLDLILKVFVLFLVFVATGVFNGRSGGVGEIAMGLVQDRRVSHVVTLLYGALLNEKKLGRNLAGSSCYLGGCRVRETNRAAR